jgi:hypothetical protein
MLHGVMILRTVAHFLPTICFLVVLSLHGRQRNKLLFPARVHRLSCKLWPGSQEKHELTKHIGVDAFFVRSEFAIQYMPSELKLWISSQRPRRERMGSFFPNSMLLIHHELRGGGCLRHV